MQAYMYDQCHELYGHKHTWIAYIDADEFFEMVGGKGLVDLLKELAQDRTVGALGVNEKTAFFLWPCCAAPIVPAELHDVCWRRS